MQHWSRVGSGLFLLRSEVNLCCVTVRPYSLLVFYLMALTNCFIFKNQDQSQRYSKSEKKLFLKNLQNRRIYFPPSTLFPLVHSPRAFFLHSSFLSISGKHFPPSFYGPNFSPSPFTGQNFPSSALIPCDDTGTLGAILSHFFHTKF